MTALVEGVAAVVRQTTERHAISVRAPGPVIAHVDAIRIEQVIRNLLENAVKYSPAGGPVVVDVGLDRAADGAGVVVIAVRDHGVGIAPEKRDRIFDRFYQAHEGAGLSGMGLGLFLSREIVELHGGRIRAEFPADGGARFVVELPARPE